MSELNKKPNEEIVHFDDIYMKFKDISIERRELFIDEDPASKSSAHCRSMIQKLMKSFKLFDEVGINISDDIMNLIDVGCSNQGRNEELLGVLIMNKHCYVQSPVNAEPMIKRSVELK
jgi:hypothetical protein